MAQEDSEQRTQEDISSLVYDLATRATGDHAAVILSGPAGCGKTHVLTAVAQSLRSALGSTVHVIDCAGSSVNPLREDAIFGYILRKFLPGVDLSRIFANASHILAHFIQPNTIIVLDDVADGTIIAAVEQMLPQSCYILASCEVPEGAPATAMIVPVPILRENSLTAVCESITRAQCLRLTDNEITAIAVAIAANPLAAYLLGRVLDTFPALNVARLLDTMLEEAESAADQAPDMLEKCFSSCYFFLSDPAQELLDQFTVFPCAVPAAVVENVLKITSAQVRAEQ